MLYPDEPTQTKDAFFSARQAQKRHLPKRFYKDVAVEVGEGGFLVLLDGRKARTPARHVLALPVRAAAEIVAADWAAVKEEIDPAHMHATRIANVGIDRMEAVRGEALDEMARYAASDLVCYRAAEPEALVLRESAAWDGVIDHARVRHGARFVLTQGVGHIAQPEASVAIVRAAFAQVANPVALAALHTLVTISGSALVALAFADGAMDAEAAFAAASVDETWNAELWGADDEAEARQAGRWAEFSAAAGLFGALKG